MTGRLERLAANRWQLSGAIVFANAPVICTQGLGMLAKTEAMELQIDCTDVQSADSACLVTLLEWLSAAQVRKIRLVFVAVPEKVLALAQISEVESFFQ
jgi:ABC-type transporter Mla MlaB component